MYSDMENVQTIFKHSKAKNKMQLHSLELYCINIIYIKKKKNIYIYIYIYIYSHFLLTLGLKTPDFILLEWSVFVEILSLNIG